MNLDKLKAIEEWPMSTKLKELQAFLELTNYYRRFIEGYAARTLQMTRLLRKNVRFEWKKEQEDQFRRLKECYQNELLVIPEREDPF